MFISCHSAFSSIVPSQKASLTTKSKQLRLLCTAYSSLIMFIPCITLWKILIALFVWLLCYFSFPTASIQLPVCRKLCKSGALFLHAYWSCPAHGMISGTWEERHCCCLVAESCTTHCDPMDCSQPGSPPHGISQARILEWVNISFSRGSSPPREDPACNGRWILYHWATWEAQEEHCTLCLINKHKSKQWRRTVIWNATSIEIVGSSSRT